MIGAMRRLFAAAAACVAFAACSAAGSGRDSAARIAGPSPRAYAYVVVSVADMQQALDLWEERFGMEISRRERGADIGLARIWGLADDAIADQALLNTPGVIDGGVHLVRFRSPADAVREGAEPTDLGPRDLEIAANDVQAAGAELAAAGVAIGWEGASAPRLLVHDAVGLVLHQSDVKRQALSSRGYGVAMQLAAVVPDIERELAFFQKVLGLELLASSAPNAVPQVRTLGTRQSPFGRLALVDYGSSMGRDLYPSAAPPARGLLGIIYVVPDLAPIMVRGREAGLADHGQVRSILGDGRMASVTSPAGLRIDFIEL
jgi:catechol 2,3-dioxygenase-like lactoylglutathione lyase family enzyme